MSGDRIGTGGWGYFRVPGMDSLTAYSRAFDFVEVNSTFYQTPEPDMVNSWVKRVPRDFEFAIRCHRDLTHRYMMNPAEHACQILEDGIGLCKKLDSRLLVLQTPRSFDPNSVLEGISDLFQSVSPGDVRFVWEIRWGPPGPGLLQLMQELGMVHCVDLSREEGPAFDSDIVYSRLFGRGWHNLYQFDDNELQEIADRVKRSGSGSIYLSFHGGRMYQDAARLKVYKKEGMFPRVTKQTGIEALREVLMEDARFPSTRQELIGFQGWKVIDMPGDRRVHAQVLLECLDEGWYENVEEVMAKVQDQNADGLAKKQ